MRVWWMRWLKRLILNRMGISIYWSLQRLVLILKRRRRKKLILKRILRKMQKEIRRKSEPSISIKIKI